MKLKQIFLGALVFTFLYFSWLHFSTAHLETYGTFVFSIVAIIWSLALQLYVVKKVKEIKKTFVFLFIIGTACYLVAELVWIFQTITFIEDLPTPGVSDLFYFLSTSFFIIAMFYTAFITSQRLLFTSFIVDLLIIYSTIVVVITMSLLIPLFKANGLDLIEMIITTLYPALVLILLLSIVIVYFYGNLILSKKTIFLLGTTALVQLIGDTLFSINFFLSIFTLNSFLEPVWSLAIILQGISIYSLLNDENANEIEKKHLFVISVGMLFE